MVKFEFLKYAVELVPLAAAEHFKILKRCIQSYGGAYLTTGDLQFLETAIEKLEQPTADVPQWIPCSERLPSEGENVLATTEWDEITIAENIGNDMWFIHEGNTNATTEDIIAWRPLPEPWKGEEDEPDNEV